MPCSSKALLAINRPQCYEPRQAATSPGIGGCEKPWFFFCLPVDRGARLVNGSAFNLLGRYMSIDRREYPCQVIYMSPGGMALVTPVR